MELGGKYFELKKQTGDTVRMGELMVEFNGEEIKNAGYSLITPVVFVEKENVPCEKAGMAVSGGRADHNIVKQVLVKT